LGRRFHNSHAERRSRRQAHREMRHELSVYTSRADIDDLMAASDNRGGPEVEAMRSILGEQALKSHRASRPFGSCAGATHI
jgi:hypothetical protein